MKSKIALAFVLLAITLAPLRTFAQSLEAASPEAATPGIFPAFITAGTVDPNGKVPVLNGVPGAGVNNLDVPMPITVLVHGTSYWYTVALQDYNYTGTCSVTFKLTQVQSGKTVTLQSGTVKSSFSTAPGNVWAWTALSAAIPNSPGVATLTASVKYGTVTTSTKTTVILQ